MKILIASADYTPDGGGIGAYAHGLWQGLSDVGCPATVLTRLTPARRPAAGELMLPVELGGTFRRNAAALATWCAALVRESRRCQSDWTVIPTWDPVAMAATIPLIRRSLRGRVAVVFHGSDVASALGRKSRLLDYVMRVSDRLLANSQFTRELIGEVYGRNASTVRPAIGPQDLVIPDVPRRDCELISVGRLVRRKGHALVIEAVARLAAGFPEIHYTIVGDGPERAALQSLAYMLGVAERVTFLGQVADEVKRKQLAAASVFVLPVREDRSDPEGFGIAYLEAGAARLPVLATRTGGVTECVREGQNGLFCEGQAASVEAALRLLLKNSDVRRRLGDGGRRIAENSQWSSRAHDLLHALGTYA